TCMTRRIALGTGSSPIPIASLRACGLQFCSEWWHFGAPRPMKMGTIASPWRYDAMARHGLQPANLGLPAILCYACKLPSAGHIKGAQLHRSQGLGRIQSMPAFDAESFETAIK